MLSKKKNQVILLAAVSSILAGIVIIIIGMTFYNYKISEIGIEENGSYKEYQYHYALISEKADALFWEAIYNGALEAGKAQNIYVEKMGSNLSADYLLYDLMKIAIAAQVDGIIIEPNEDERIVELINEADKAGIPVITVIMDAPQSSRKSFIGINSYNQGQMYGKQVLELIEEGKHKITVLVSSDNSNTNQSVIYSSIIEAVREKNVEVSSKIINTQSTFSSEEDIRKILMDAENAPDVLVCLTASDTLSAYQAIVDYNRVGEIEIIGYYNSEIIINAIEKNIIHATMTFDARQMGAYCVEALVEYNKTKHVSVYYSVDVSIIDSDNVKNYLESDTGE
ncbi:substrate-binding domain-containing protein [Anaeromicropila populeti]|uniref:Ribose transport system substrate-binding protein n=1 Tax=Anaeromicropila populeti TaxID=37658 RepID=A0A1I6K016_9FIRM|nr:substrate-binding domain-containing protein [Anaeromicropila populeti]SFR84556.1 ribose transport system substrate-binding protein [Anaeromicropila populeti]